MPSIYGKKGNTTTIDSTDQDTETHLRYREIPEVDESKGIYKFKQLIDIISRAFQPNDGIIEKIIPGSKILLDGYPLKLGAHVHKRNPLSAKVLNVKFKHTNNEKNSVDIISDHNYEDMINYNYKSRDQFGVDNYRNYNRENFEEEEEEE